MRYIVTHHDGHGLNESIKVEVLDEPGPGGANRQYEFRAGPFWPNNEGISTQGNVGYLHFQRGPRNEEGSIPGVTEGAVIAVLIDRLEAFQAGPYACRENQTVLNDLRDALYWVKKRSDNRAQRGVLGTTQV